MRRGAAILVPLLLLATLAAPSAVADHEAPRREQDEAPPEEPAAPPPETEVAEPGSLPPVPENPLGKAPGGKGGRGDSLAALRDQLDGVEPAFGLATLGLGGIGLLALASIGAQRALRPRPSRPPRRSFEAGRAKGVREGMRRDPLSALPDSGLGDTQAAPHGDGYAVTLHRARGTRCEYAAGYFAGLFEGAWAEDVRVAHPACAGKDRKGACLFVVERAARGPLSRASGPMEASWTRG